MKMKLMTACVLAACGVVPPAFAAGAVDLASCCTPGDKDFPKVGGNLGNQNYSSLRQIDKGRSTSSAPPGSTASKAASPPAPTRAPRSWSTA